MEQETKSLRANHTWDLVELPRDGKTVGSKWIYKVKIKADGSIERYKARLVAQGYTQKFGVDYDETFCPVVRMESFRIILASAIQLHQIDVTTAFLNGKLEEEVYMKQPQGFILKGQEELVCRLNKSIHDVGTLHYTESLTAWAFFNQLVIHVCTKRIQEEIFSSLVCMWMTLCWLERPTGKLEKSRLHFQLHLTSKIWASRIISLV